MLQKLKSLNKKLIVATSKPEVFAKKILDHFDLTKYFDFVAGATLDSSRVKKDDVIEYALNSCGIDDMSSVLMIGDREHDVIGAARFGINSVGVLFGYGSREELELAGATFIAERVDDILKIIV